MEGPKNIEANEREKALTISALRFADELLRANLLVPQTYGAIRSLVALSLLKETNTEHDFSPKEIYNELEKNEAVIAEKFVQQMQSAHTSSEVTVRSYDDTTPEKVNQRVVSLIRHHKKIVLDAMVDILHFTKDYSCEENDSKVQEQAIVLMQLVCDALLGEGLRESIRGYREKIAQKRIFKSEYAEDLTTQWGAVFLSKLQASILAPKTPQELEKLALLFTDVTNASERLGN